MATQKSVRGLGAILALALAALLAGCAAPALPWQQQRQGPRPLPDARQVAHVALAVNSDPSDLLDPMHAQYFKGGPAQVVTLLYSGLFTLDARHVPVPALATAYDVTGDGLRYTFHLWENARFAEGAPLTSADAAFSLNRAMTDCSSVSLGLFDAVKGAAVAVQACGSNRPRVPSTLIGDSILAPDPTTLVIALSRPDAALVAKLAEPYSLIVERSFVARYGDQWTEHLADGGGQGTSGMYAIAGWTRAGKQALGSLTLTRARGYWGPRPLLREVDVALRSFNQAPPFPNATRYLPITSSDDIVFGSALPTPGATQRNGVTYHIAPARLNRYLLLNTQVAPLNDARVRQALALALDKTALAGLINGLPTNHLVPPDTGVYPATLSGDLATAPLTGDATRAKALWQSYVQSRCGGVASRCAKMFIYVTSSSTFENALAIRWQTVLPGIRIIVTGYPGQLMTTQPPPFSIMDTDWYEDYPDPQDWLLPLVGAPGFPGYLYYAQYLRDAQANALFARAEASLDPGTRSALYQQAEDALINDAVAIPIAQAQNTWALRSTVAGFPANPTPWIPPAAWARIALTTTASQ
jgi:oligopeptide transport system substrate-binding protein